MNIWTEAKVEQLKELHAEGLSLSAIAAQLGPDFTRNAVVGKIHRLGFAPKERTHRAAPYRRIHQKKPSTEAPKTIVQDEPIPDISAIEFADIIPIKQRLTFMKLTNKTCRFPVGDPTVKGFFFCGGKADLDAGRSYCNFHHRLTHQPPDAVRRIFVPMRVVRA